MEIILKRGIDKLLFGMKQPDVIALYGKPDKTYKDEDHNTILMYNKLKIRLTFYSEEELRLGYIITSNADVVLFGKRVVGGDFAEVRDELSGKGVQKFTVDEFDGFENFFNEDSWIIFQTEFGEVTKFEMGAMLDANDEFVWVF